MKTALMFPGQASQYVGMAQDLYERDERARGVMDAAEEITGLPLRKLCFEGPDDLLTRTENAQPAIVAASLAALAAWDGEFHIALGHSLGEYSALAGAGALSLEQALGLVVERGRLMARADSARPGTMAAVVGLGPGEVQEALAAVKGTVILANINSPSQMVISGEKPAVAEASNLLKQKGAKRVIPLRVSAAFHSPLMESAARAMREEIARVEFQEPRVPVIPCSTAKPTSDPRELKQALMDQLTSPVPWVDMLKVARASGAERFVEMGPGKVLQGLSKRTLSDVKIEGFGS